VKPDLGDVVVRARGLAVHLLSQQALEQLARCSGGGALARALQGLGYWPGGGDTSTPSSIAEEIDDAIERKCRRRLDVLARWLGARRALFAGVFEDEERAAIRIWLRRAASPAGKAVRRRAVASAGGGSAHVDPGRAADLNELVRSLARGGSPYAEVLENARRTRGETLTALESALDRAFAQRARRAARRLGGRLLAWVSDGIDLENAWDALVDGGGDFVEGGRRLTRERQAAISREATEPARRRELANVFSRSPFAPVFGDRDVPLAALEGWATRVRIAEERRAARVEPLGAAPILEVVMLLRAERSDLRRINWGVDQGLPTEAIAHQLTEALL
jgi:hypothetical protein